ncbi:MAG TPA: M24 family metallopeptidase [Gemmatimonadales bacterium]|nr:M24 family metallopeptidase [Gemmatimonadales bacterium]
MTALERVDWGDLREQLAQMGADAWLLWSFRGVNPVADRVLGMGGMGTRRLFVLLPRDGEAVAVAHRIELQPLAAFPGRVIAYSRWQELKDALKGLVAGRTVAMEVSEDDAVPYLDRVPYGVVQLIQRLGGRVISSAPLVTRFAATWSGAELEDHLFAAEILAEIARAAVAETVQSPAGVTEFEVQQKVAAAVQAKGLVFDHPPIVAFGANTANPHYEPKSGRSAALKEGDVVLLDLWAGRRMDTVFADQTWMGFAGARPTERVLRVWETVRSARDAAIALLRERWRASEPVYGFEADQAARGVIDGAGWGAGFVHRTGHSIDRDLHGSGPHLDDYETRDDRRLVAGIGFSVEPGIYLPGEFGMRSEVNVHLEAAAPRVTPREPQRNLILKAS